MNSRSYRPSSMMTLAMPRANAPSVPGLSCRWMSAREASGVTRGSTTMSFMPRPMASSMPRAPVVLA